VKASSQRAKKTAIVAVNRFATLAERSNLEASIKKAA
jgi:hypothetical protein